MDKPPEQQMRHAMDPQTEKNLRDIIIDNPKIVLDDPSVMRALVLANDEMRGENIVDLRSVAMKRLETRLGQLEATHRSVIAAAYDNLVGAQQINRAILKILEPNNFDSFLMMTGKDMPDIMRIDFACLILETDQQERDPKLAHLSEVLITAPIGFVTEYLPTSTVSNGIKVTLRKVTSPNKFVYAGASCEIGSEACIQLDFGDETVPGLLVLGAQNSNQFSSAQGTDLLKFFGTVYERAVHRWLM
tara:strand:+ start:206 stop:943 length:738 start_codon:yes stop_codon:yes gene_type:complete